MGILTSLLIIAVPVVAFVFFVLPRLRGSLVDMHPEARTLWQRISAYFWSFQTLIVGGVGLALPEILYVAEQIQLVDLSHLSPGWQMGIRVASISLIIFARAGATTPIGRPPSGEA